MRIFENTNFNFIGNRKKAYVFSGILLLLSIGSLIARGLELGIDFQGGMEFVVESPVALNPVEVRSQLATVLGSEPEVKTFGVGQVLIRTSAEGDISAIQNLIVEGIAEGFAGSNPEVIKTDVVGPRFAEDLKQGAIWAILGGLLVVFVYILLRFEWRFGVGAVSALFHDVTITLGIFSAAAGVLPFSLQVDQAIIAAFLTIVGYSLNDTVVVFDRIREYSNLFKTETYEKLVNRSINNTLSRTIVTSGTTLLVVVVLFIFGGEVLRGFAFGLILGVTIGTYSSVFVASPIVVELRARAKQPVDECLPRRRSGIVGAEFREVFMKYDVEEQGRVAVLALEGNILGGPDGTKLHDRLHELKDAGKRHVVVDLSRVRFMNSSGLGMLISAMTTMRNAGGDFRLAGMGDGIRSLLVITRLDTIFKHYESVDEAVRSYEEDPPAPA